MKTFTITRQTFCKREMLLKGEYCIVSRSGLHPAERLMIEQIQKELPDPGHILCTGGRTGAVAFILADLFPNAVITVHAYDIHHADTLYRNLLSNGLTPLPETDPDREIFGAFLSSPCSHGRIRVACTSSLPDRPVDAALMILTDGAQTAELALDQLDEIASRLTPGGKLLITGNAIRDPFVKQVKSRFGGILLKRLKKDFSVIRAVATPEPKTPRSFSATFEAGLPPAEGVEIPPATFVTLPGVFSHRRADSGGLALAEVAAASGKIRPGATLLDMGCGCGMVGILLAKAIADAQLICIDSSARALEATVQNLKSNGLSARLILSSTGAPEDAKADVYLANPPYFSDYTIAETFLSTAHALLAPGGTLFFVAKAIEKPRLLMEKLGFKAITPIPRRGYTVLQATR